MRIGAKLYEEKLNKNLRKAFMEFTWLTVKRNLCELKIELSFSVAQDVFNSIQFINSISIFLSAEVKL